MDRMNIVLIPAYEPEPALIALVREAWEDGFSVVVVDDGSGSAYEPVFRQTAEYALVLTHEKNLGKGAALKTGMRYILGRYGKACTIVTMDADGQHRVKDAARLCSMAQLHPEALVLGSRRKLTEKAPLRSRFGNAVTRNVYRLVTGCQVYDTQTGLRAFDGEWIQTMVEIEGDRYEYEMNVLLRFAGERLPVIETEIDTIYEEGNPTSHFQTLKDSYRIYKEILKFSLSSFIGFLVDYAMYAVLLVLAGMAGMYSGAGLILANVGARFVSAMVNYTINRKLVFKSNAPAASSAVRYFLLAAALLVCNTLILTMLVGGLGVNRFAAKILVELFLFFVSWFVQKRVVFRDRRKQTWETATK